MPRVLVVDDEEPIRSSLSEFFAQGGYEVDSVESAEAALERMKQTIPDVLLTDIRMNGMDGSQLLLATRKAFPSVRVVLMTAHATIDSAVHCLKQGAYDYLLKPFTLEQLEHVFRKLEEQQKLRAENALLRDRLHSLLPTERIDTKNAQMQKVLDLAGRVARSDSIILLTGESGTGKTLLAKLIHENSPRAGQPFAVVNCATLSESLLESELFGHVRGAFTGAVRDKIGRLQVADGGTVFLDEIGEITPTLQTKLLRFVQDLEFEKVGDTKTIRVNVRIIAATNKNLEAEVRAGRFREDLYFRLNVVDLRMPSLRERKEDLPMLADALLAKSFEQIGKPVKPIERRAREAILQYDWPGNIRELKNALERAAILCTGDEVQIEDLPDRIFDQLTQIERPDAPIVSLAELERQHIQEVMTRCETLEEAAAVLGINASTLWRKRQLYGFS